MQPLIDGDPSMIGRSIHELAQGSRTFPLVEGLNPSFWENEKNSNCHNWTQENLCKQGKFYVVRWAEDGRN